jgi:hypothetical protein
MYSALKLIPLLRIFAVLTVTVVKIMAMFGGQVNLVIQILSKGGLPPLLFSLRLIK